MANRETFPAAQSPLTGDISGPAGATTVTVTGIQTQLVSPAIPIDKDTFRFNAGFPRWEPTADGNASVTLGEELSAGGVITKKGINISDDYDFLVDNVPIDGLVGWVLGDDSQVFVDGSPVL